eukprot:CAMPEP_0178722952 /NCGR_PEP_ID=MMETSP0699-20121125/25282_1 /TAXON_ID=265572 /ORGANISM="Extubocellulus spinifer, Strain CCMP396" /LENGTH=347 /DNA_ID=CAMNT_0020373989 /DNA_START=32 /DNA_END=1075 /DNA_ORIENTATION=+
MGAAYCFPPSRHRHFQLLHCQSIGSIQLTAQSSNEGADIIDAAATNSAPSVAEGISSLLARLSDNNEVLQSTHESPRVYIIGTGLSNEVISLPLTTLSILANADVVLHDSLSLPASEIRKVVPTGCVVRSVGKRGDDKDSVLQSEIDELMVQYATEFTASVGNGESSSEFMYPNIVRLKGGDPFLFGRSRTEIDALRDNDISYRVIPNLSSSVAGPHFAGIPLTDPLLKADSFAVFSGTNADGIGIGTDDGGRDWGDMAVDTLIFLMIGRVDKLDQLRTKLIDSRGDRWTAQTNCAVVQSAGRAEQQVWRATLGNIVENIQEYLGEDSSTVSPAVFVVGRVASLDLT